MTCRLNSFSSSQYHSSSIPVLCPIQQEKYFLLWAWPLLRLLLRNRFKSVSGLTLQLSMWFNRPLVNGGITFYLLSVSGWDDVVFVENKENVATRTHFQNDKDHLDGPTNRQGKTQVITMNQLTLTAFSRHFCPKWLTHIHKHNDTVTAVSTMQGHRQLVWSKQG